MSPYFQTKRDETMCQLKLFIVKPNCLCGDENVILLLIKFIGFSV